MKEGMTLSVLQELIEIYAGLRTQGNDSKRALEILRVKIASLSTQEQAEFVRQVRQWETRRAEARAKDDTRPKIKPIEKKTLTSQGETTGSKTLPVAPELRQQIHADLKARAMTGTHDLGDREAGWDTFFAAESVMSLTDPKTNVSLKVRPQLHEHDIVIGRGDASFAPDVDLTALDAAKLGVSRMHLTVHYDAKQSTLSITDMDTTNGTFINGVRLLPQEVRVLRHGDELRLGRLIMIVHFYFAEARS
ncbi:MAG: FHA domain-containing protein [Anaerolineae bacterium]|nr:FHA domain-containing protein [Anaerolineae bacterium]MCA9907848.1 FHA domain-containing protein [Anaerolineae bacterium]